jgi:putative endonuclease
MDGETAAYVYLVRCGDGSLYCGVAKDVASRVALHNTGRGARYTRSRGPVTLVYMEPAVSWGAALSRERVIKSWRRSRKEELVRSAAGS